MRDAGGLLNFSILILEMSTALFLTPSFGRILAYHGKFAGLPWPTSLSMYTRKATGTQVPDIEKDFTPEHIIIYFHGKFIKYTPDYFIVTDTVLLFKLLS